MAKLLRGKPVADAVVANARTRADALMWRGVRPTLAVVRVGADPGDLSYERTLAKRAEAAGVGVQVRALPADASQEQLEAALAAVNADASVHGCLLFRPLPAGLDEVAACALIAPAKDVDGITRASLASVLAGDALLPSSSGPCGEAAGAGAGDASAPFSAAGFAPSTAEACVRLLDFYDVPLSGARVTVVGRSLVVGRPLALLLAARDATVTLCHSRTRDVPSACRAADIVVLATGRARAFDGSFFREGQTVLDVGVNFDETGAMCGDADASSVEPMVAAFTPVPGGIGSVTTAVTLEHVVAAAERASR